MLNNSAVLVPTFGISASSTASSSISPSSSAFCNSLGKALGLYTIVSSRSLTGSYGAIFVLTCSVASRLAITGSATGSLLFSSKNNSSISPVSLILEDAVGKGDLSYISLVFSFTSVLDIFSVVVPVLFSIEKSSGI